MKVGPFDLQTMKLLKKNGDLTKKPQTPKPN